MQVFWISEPPKFCETCKASIEDIFYDARTKYGPWALMCPSCFHIGPGIGKLGTGYGQKYKLTNGKWLKIDG